MCLASEAGEEFGQIHLPEVFTAAGPHGHLFSRLFLFADNQLVRQLLQAMFPNFIGYFFIPQVGLAAPSGVLQMRCNARRVSSLALGDIKHRNLHRRKPQRHRAGVVLDENADEAFHRADDRPMQHDRYLARIVFGDVLRTEQTRHGKIDLHGAALPGATDAVFQMVFDLGAVEGALSREHLVAETAGIQGCLKRAFGLVPELVGADPFQRARGEFVDDLGEAEVCVDLLQQRRKRRDLRLDLLLGAKYVAVVLGESADAHDAMQCARGFVAGAHAELAVAQRQLAVAVQALVVDQHVTGTVHRLDRVVALLRLGGEHQLLVIFPMAGFLPQTAVEELRAAHFEIAVVPVDAAHVLLDLLPDRPTFRMPEHHARGFFLEVEKIELRAQPPVIALLRLLDHAQVRFLLLLLGPGSPVDPLQHLVLGISAPVGAGDLHQLEYLELAGGGNVRAAAQIDEIPFPVQRNLFVRGNRRDDLRLVALADGFEVLNRLVARPDLARHREVLFCQFRHALFDGTEIVRRERPLERKIVVEAVFNYRPDGHLRLGEQLLHGVGEQVRSGVPKNLEALFVALGDDGELAIALETVRGIDQFSVHPPSEGGARQPRSDRLSDFGDGDRTGKALYRAVRKADIRHAFQRAELKR